MSFITELDVVNDCLKTLGELPLNSLDDEHDLVPAALRCLNRANTREQAKAWWFNKELTTLTPNEAGNIILPGDTIRIDPTDRTLNYVQRGNKLYQATAPATVDKFQFTRPVQCWLVRAIPFDELPPMAQNVISVAAVLDFQKDYDADPVRVSELKEDYRIAYMTLNAEHIRNVQANRLQSFSVQRAMRRIGPSYYSSY